MARKIEFGAGIATAVLATLLLFVLLFVPILQYCSVELVNNQCPANGTVRSITVGEAATPGLWAFLLVFLAVLYAGAAGAIAEARFDRREGAIPLWIAAVLAFMACAYFASFFGQLYAPAVLALAIAAYASVSQRMRGRRHPLLTPRGQRPDNG